MPNHKIFSMPFSSVYPLYINKVERKNREKKELDEVIYWLTGYDEAGLAEQIAKDVSMATFFDESPQLNPNMNLIKGVVCGVRVEEIDNPMMQKIRYLDKLVDELAKGKSLEKIFRK